ncbi:hypothetical protein Trydic_g10437 [Trypoxylus dichotomus]
MAAAKTQPPEYRWKVRTAIEKAKPKQIRQNISKPEQRSLKELMTVKNIKILPADRGTATGLPKIHKPGSLLRTIVSSRNSPCHPLTKFLLDIISPPSGNTQSAITKTKHFINQIKEITINEHDKLVSFDVTSLFTNVPTEAALAIVKNRLSRDTTSDERTSLSVEAITELLSTCVNTT